jgi:hypothetical protein
MDNIEDLRPLISARIEHDAHFRGSLQTKMELDL